MVTQVGFRNNTPPEDEERVRCVVCGWPGVDAKRTGQPETTPTVYTSTGTTWHASDLALIDKVVTFTVPAYSACPFCGSPRWQDGSRGSL